MTYRLQNGGLVMDKKKYQRKVNQQGNSLSVGIPAEIAEKINLKKGETLDLTFNEETNELIYKKRQDSKLRKGINSEFLEVLDGVLCDYEEALYNLKDR